MATPLILVEAQPRRADTGAAVTVRLAGGGGAKPYLYSDAHWRAGLTGLPRIVAGIDFDGTDLGTGSVPQAMQLRWAPAGQAGVAELAAYHWVDAAITVRVGPEGALPPVLTSGKVLSATVDGGALVIALADPAADLRKPILTSRFAGTGGVEGPAELEGRIKPRAWGRVFNVEGFVLDAANNIYCYGDPARPWDSFVAVRDKGAAAAVLNVLAWQGSVAATFAALQAAAAPQGGGVACPSIACVKWWTQPAGTLCADIKGENAGGYVETAAQIAARIAATVSAVPFAAGTVAAGAAARPAPVGWYQAEEGGTAAAALDRLLSDVSLLWVLDADSIVIRSWEWGASTASARSLDVSRRASFKPVTRRRLGYRRNQHKMSRDAIAGIVLATDVILDDGTSAQDAQTATLALIEAAQALAEGKSKWWSRAAPPTAAESGEGDWWSDSDDGNYLYRRLPGNGVLSIGGSVVTFGGSPVVFRPWAPAPDQRIADALASAASAMTAAQAAQATADDAIDSLTAMADDGVLTAVEKKQLILDDSRLQGAWAVLDAQAATFGITTERTAAANARTAWLALRGGLSPAWNDVTTDTAIVRATFVAVLSDYDAALTTLQKAISAKAATTADWDGVTGAGKTTLLADAATAKANASTALGEIAIIQSDGYLSRAEKPDIIRRRADIEAEYGGLVAKASAQAVSTATYSGAYSALIAYLDALSPAWNNTALDTAIVPATFNGKFTDYYFARTQLFADSADLTAANQQDASYPLPIDVAADYLGTVNAGQLPAVRSIRRYVGVTDVSPNTSYGVSATAGLTVSINNTPGSDQRGDVSLDALAAASGKITVTATYAGSTLYRDIPVTRNDGPAPTGGGTGGAGPPVTTAVSTPPGTSTTHVATGSVIPVTVGSSGTVNLAASCSFECATEGSVDETVDFPTDRYIDLKWIHSATGTGGWSDVGTEQIASSPAQRYLRTSTPKGQVNNPGYASISRSKTGLAAGTHYFRLVSRSDSGWDITSISGSATATPA